jgi:hypothetical protein
MAEREGWEHERSSEHKESGSDPDIAEQFGKTIAENNEVLSALKSSRDHPRPRKLTEVIRTSKGE